MRALPLAALALLVLAAPPPLEATPEGQKLVVVVAAGSKVKALSRADLRRIFINQPVTVGGVTLVPFNSPPGSASRAAFDQKVLGMSPSEMGRFWVDRKVRGELVAPRSLPSITNVLKVVAKYPGAISYVPADALTEAVQPVAIDGVAHTDQRYSIKLP